MRLPVIGIALAVAVVVAAYFSGRWRIAIGAVLLLVVSLPLLVVGLVKRVARAAKGPLLCPSCRASEKTSPGFNRTSYRWISYTMVKCNTCGEEWHDRS